MVGTPTFCISYETSFLLNFTVHVIKFPSKNKRIHVLMSPKITNITIKCEVVDFTQMKKTEWYFLLVGRILKIYTIIFLGTHFI